MGNNGISVNFPCRVGDKIYVDFGVSVAEYTVDDFVYDGYLIWCHASNESYSPENRNIYRCISFDLGKTIFLDRNQIR